MTYARFAADTVFESRSRDAAIKHPTIKRGVLFRSGFSLRVAAMALTSAISAVVFSPQAARAEVSASAASVAKDPTASVKAVIDQATAIIRDTQAPAADRDKSLRRVAEANFDFTDMARTTLGYHWREITDQQRSEFIPLFTSFMENVYLSKLQEYNVQKLRDKVSGSNVSFTGQQFDGADYAEVHSTVQLKDHPQPLKVDYLLKRDGNGWKIYDLEVDSISVMANYRQQFNRVLNNQGYPALISSLRKKAQELGSTLAE